jgi:hypothetical protein
VTAKEATAKEDIYGRSRDVNLLLTPSC